MSLKKIHSEQPKDFRFSNDNLKKADSAIENSLSEYGKNLIQIRGKSSLVITIKDFVKIPEEIQFRLLFRIIGYISNKKNKPRAKSISNLMKKMIRRDFKSMTVHGCIFVNEGKEISIMLEHGRSNKTKKKRQLISFTKKGISDLFI